MNDPTNVIDGPLAQAVSPSPGSDAAADEAAAAAPSREQLFALLYADLRRLAQYQINRRWGPALTLGATTLLHEAYIHVVSTRVAGAFPSHGHFLSYASQTMRSIIVDRARQRQQLKRGGEWDIVTLTTDMAANIASPQDVLDVDEHLRSLQAVAPDLARLVDLRFFCGMTLAEISALLGHPERSLRREWEKARSLLVAMIRGDVVAPAAGTP